MRTDLTIAEAVAALTAVLPEPRLEHVPLLAAHNRILAEDMQSLVDHPNTNDSALDGFAVQLEVTKTASPETPVRLKVVGEVAAGALAFSRPLEAHEAVKVFTGGAVPLGATGIAMVEHTARDGDDVLLLQPAVPEIRLKGQDLEIGQTYLAKGTRLNGSSIALAAAMGHAVLPVFEKPRIALLSTGDEIVEPGSPLPEGGVYNANSYGLAAKLLELGAEPMLLPKVADSLDGIRAAILAARGAHLVLTIGGVSMGERDFVRKLLESEGTIDFWRIKVKPGGPPILGSLDGIPVFGLPGNPVSSLVVFHVVVQIALAQRWGDVTPSFETVRAKAITPFKSAGAKQGLWRANLEWSTDHYTVAAFSNQSSQVLRSLTQSNALAVVPENETRGVGDWLEVIKL